MTDEQAMQEAILEAKKAYKKNEVPVGCVIVLDDVIVARAHNTRHHTKNVLDHAEMVAIKKACKKLGRWILDDATIYVTLEPCLMCSGAILQARMKKLVYGKNEPKFGCVESILQVFSEKKFNHQVAVIKGVKGQEIEVLMKDFFKNLRVNKRMDK